MTVTPSREIVVTFDEYQKGAARTMNASLSDDERLQDAAAGIAEEAGEVLAHIRKPLYQGSTLDHEKLAEELGDVLRCVATVATRCGIRMSEVADQNANKLVRRWPDGLSTPASPQRPTVD